MTESPHSEIAVCGILLHPAGHTRSPAMHNAAYRACGLKAVYHAFDVKPERLGSAIEDARAQGLRQLAVSIPHKEAIMEHLDRVDETALAIGACNTVTREGEALVGQNTDWTGALKALRQEVDPRGLRAVVLGAGGAARAVIYGLLKAGSEVSILNRTETRASELAGQLGAHGSGRLDELGDLQPEIIINTTSVGLRSENSPVSIESIPASSVVMDAVYDPEKTRLLRDAEQRGARTLGGKWMLIHQAAEQFSLWTGLDAPIQVMGQAFDRAGH
ncbi:MAG: shikimate dehydrogenase [Myxococcota bacterium]|nr:shikimate dehydrogenase [Myxococcota bacterium]